MRPSRLHSFNTFGRRGRLHHTGPHEPAVFLEPLIYKGDILHTKLIVLRFDITYSTDGNPGVQKIHALNIAALGNLLTTGPALR